MKLLILSDSHGNVYNIRTALIKHRDADRIVFLGDGERDFDNVGEELAGRPLTMVCGNCDFGSLLNPVELLRINDRIVFCTHGHRQFVKYGTDELIMQGQKAGASLILFGHTHEQYESYFEGTYILNPGSINNYEYALADITEQGIVVNSLSLRKY